MIAPEKTVQSVKIVAYYRVSTKRQGESGLGLEAQRDMVLRYSECGRVVEEYTEVETGKRADRPQLSKAIDHARLIGARLVIAKLDRLARNMAFTSALMDSGVDFVCCDNPHANRLTIHILAAIAEDEARRISERTCAGLNSIRRRIEQHGFHVSKAGNRITGLGAAREGYWDDPERAGRMLDGLSKARQASCVSRKGSGAVAVAFLLPKMRELRAEGLSLQAIADRLNEQGLTTRMGKPWHKVAVMRTLGESKRMVEVRAA